MSASTRCGHDPKGDPLSGHPVRAATDGSRSPALLASEPTGPRGWAAIGDWRRRPEFESNRSVQHDGFGSLGSLDQLACGGVDLPQPVQVKT
jgi:hypothetical protein